MKTPSQTRPNSVTTPTQDLTGLPQLPQSVDNGAPKGRSMEKAATRLSALTVKSPNVVTEVQTNPDRTVGPALRILANGIKDESLYHQGIQVVRGLLDMYSVNELDELLLSCGKAEREILLKSLLKKRS